MAWDDKSDQGAPFGEQMPDFEMVWRRYKGWIITAAVLLFVGVSLSFSFYTVRVNEEAVVLRFGKYMETTTPGLHFKLPFGIDRVLKEEVKTIHKEEFGFRTMQAGKRSFFESTQQDEQVALMLTADLNCAEITWVVRYKIGDLRAYLFKVRNVRESIRDVSEAIMRKIVGDSSIDEVLMSRPEEMARDARREIQALLNEYECGIDIIKVNIKRFDPPKAVKDAFEEVNQARQLGEQIINEAEASKNRELIPAEGRKKKMIESAKGYEQKRVNEAKGDADAFLAVLAEYEKAREITRQRMYLETMAKILPSCGKIFLIDEKQQGLLPLLRLDDAGGSIP